ncbi:MULTISPECIES: hypothetical protein [Pseudomonas]|uniref:hypothetical protein n=1 Tax=Pseudomonas TaxID=286 RepID=UPI0015B3A4C0|nr:MULTISPECIES: hypothetical protein [Pseudomonas]
MDNPAMGLAVPQQYQRTRAPRSLPAHAPLSAMDRLAYSNQILRPAYGRDIHA